MGFQARKSFKLMPGVRMTVTPRGISTSLGVKGARVSVHSSGRVTRTVGIPGTGVRYTETVRSGRAASQGRSTKTEPARSRTAQAPKAAEPPKPPPLPHPGLLAPAWEKTLFDAAVRRRDPAAIHAVAVQHQAAQPAAAALETLYGALPAGDTEGIRRLLGWLWSTGFDPATDPFISKYAPGLGIVLEIAPGIRVELPLDRDTIGLTLAEAHQRAGALADAVRVVEHVTPSTVAAVSLAELYIAQSRWADVIDLTNGLTNDDEAAMFLLVQRAVALRESGNPDAARDALKEALRVRSRPAALRHAALITRADTYLAEHKLAMARRDLDRVLAEDAGYPGLREALAQLPDV